MKTKFQKIKSAFNVLFKYKHCIIIHIPLSEIKKCVTGEEYKIDMDYIGMIEYLKLKLLRDIGINVSE